LEELKMTEKKKAGATWHGFVEDTHPIYKGGWNFLVGRNLPKAKRAPEGDDGDGEVSKGV
jgi:hypothetical protein